MEEAWIRDERAVLGAALMNAGLLPDLLIKLKPGYFFRAAHQIIFTKLIELFQKYDEVDAALLASELSESKEIGRIGGAVYLFELAQEAPLANTALALAENVKAAYSRRKLHEAGLRIQQVAQEGGEVDDLTAYAQSLLEEASTVDEKKITRLGETLQQTLDAVNDARSGKLPERGVLTGFRQLDEMTDGLKSGQMIIVAARPGVGKSTFAVDIMRHAAIVDNVPSLFFSLEMSEKEVRNRILSAESSLKTKDIEKGNLTDVEVQNLTSTAQRISGAPIFIDDSPETTMIDIAAKTKLMVKKQGVGLVVIDYLQLLKSGTRAESRQQEVSDFSRQIKLLAKSCKVPVIAIAQLNRGVEKREDSIPRISDLRESGALEQDADMVLLIHRPDVSDKDHARAGEADLIVGKHRGGEVGTVVVAHQMHYSRFKDMPKGIVW